MHKKSFSMNKQIKKLSNLFASKSLVPYYPIHLLPCKHKFVSIFGLLRSKAVAFTMAEILLSLTIIGVVAAITLPSLTGNINEKTWNTQRKALYARMSQAIALMPALNGYGQYEGTWSETDGSASVNVTTDTAAMTFVTEGLSKVLKINNICDNEHFEDCGLPDQYTKFYQTSKVDFPKKLSELIPFFTANDDHVTYLNPQRNVDTKAVAFETQNGESVALFYNPYCVDKNVEFIQEGPAAQWGTGKSVLPYYCAIFLYDLNGRKGPNTMGKDEWFITALYSSDTSVVMIDPDKITASEAADQNGQHSDFAGAQQYCALRDARMFNVDEAIAIKSAGLSPGWLSGDTGKSNTHFVITRTGTLIKCNNGSRYVGVRCIKR